MMMMINKIMEFYLITIVIVFSIILLTGEILKTKPKWLVNLFVDIWNKPYPDDKQIDRISSWLVVISYLVILSLSIYKKY